MELASLGSTPAHFTAISGGGYAGAHPHFWDRAISRRSFLAGAGATVAAATVGDLLWPSAASASTNGGDGPTPIPNGIIITGPNGPKLFHLFLPGPSDNLAGSLASPGGEQVTIYNFAGDFGVAAISGTGTGTDTVTRTSQALFYDVDMRFFDGQFIDRRGERRSATFGFVWLDVYTDAAHSTQIHDFNPGIRRDGLFWTRRLSGDSVEVDLDDAAAVMRARDLDVEDYFTLGNALFGGIPEIPATVSFEIHWRGAQRRFRASNDAHGNRYRGRYVQVTTATINGSGHEKGFAFVSTPGSSQTKFAELGHERNGAFFRWATPVSSRRSASHIWQ